jgi:hypothetical protein
MGLTIRVKDVGCAPAQEKQTTQIRPIASLPMQARQITRRLANDVPHDWSPISAVSRFWDDKAIIAKRTL